MPGTRVRNKPHQSEGADISHTETVSSKNSESNLKLYIIIGSVFGVLIIIVLSCMFVFVRQKHSMEAACGMYIYIYIFNNNILLPCFFNKNNSVIV